MLVLNGLLPAEFYPSGQPPKEDVAAEKEQLQRSLQTWIAQYIDGDPKNSSEETKARRPLAGAEIMVVEDEENPGYYMGKFFLRPHFQMEGMDIGMSLVSRLPSGT